MKPASLTLAMLALMSALFVAGKLKLGEELVAATAVVGLSAVLLMARRQSPAAASMRGALVIVALIAAGLGVGTLTPPPPLAFLPVGLPVLIGIFFMLGVPELALHRRWNSMPTTVRLNGQPFPFFAMGLVIGLALQM